jgi:lysophospholipid acyltransferase (LPLAT)-like uncharacterized protein
MIALQGPRQVPPLCRDGSALAKRLQVPEAHSVTIKAVTSGTTSAKSGEIRRKTSDDNDVSRFTLGQRVQLWLISWIGYLGVAAIGRTLRVTVSMEEGSRGFEHGNPGIGVFWHRCVFPAAWIFRKLGIAVMTSRSYDGEYIARIIDSFGFLAVRGSSSRGAVGALLGMHTFVEQGHTVAFTIDGPRGPRYVAKPGPVLLARNTQVPIVAFHIACQRAWVLKSWDRFMIPKPFSRVAVRFSRAVTVELDADSATLERKRDEMQVALDRARGFAEREVGVSL